MNDIENKPEQSRLEMMSKISGTWLPSLTTDQLRRIVAILDEGKS